MSKGLARTAPSVVFGDDEQKWQAVTQRDLAGDGVFFYSVRTTGVYCRPSCAARLARRENVAFHGSCAEAERAGFRPCKRCRPNVPRDASPHAAGILRACRALERAENPPSLAALAALADLSPFHFHRVFKALIGVTPKAYADAERARRVHKILRGSSTVTAAVYAAGFNSSGRFYANSSAMLGMTPSEYRAGGVGLQIKFATGACSLGVVLVAATARGVCAILLGDTPQALAESLVERFPRADLLDNDAEFITHVGKVIKWIDKPSAIPLALDVQGTAFQHSVWQALREIPSGTTATYAEIANKIGNPRAVRAVAQACAANPTAIAIPCHRVIRTDGELGGYRWGIERKRALLAREKG